MRQAGGGGGGTFSARQSFNRRSTVERMNALLCSVSTFFDAGADDRGLRCGVWY